MTRPTPASDHLQVLLDSFFPNGVRCAADCTCHGQTNAIPLDPEEEVVGEQYGPGAFEWYASAEGDPLWQRFVEEHPEPLDAWNADGNR